MENRDMGIAPDLSEDELMHYGRKGMKWYQNIYTKAKTSSEHRKEKKKAEAAAERQKRIDSGKIKPKDMTDDELRARKARLQAEKDVKELENKTKVLNKGAEFVKSAAMGPGKKILWDTSVDLAAQTFKKVGATKINELLRKAGFGDQDIREFVKTLSDEDLKKENERLKAESDYINYHRDEDFVFTNNQKKK